MWIDFQNSKNERQQKSGESIAMNFNNVNCAHVQEQKLFLEKLKTKRYQNVVRRTFVQKNYEKLSYFCLQFLF